MTEENNMHIKQINSQHRRDFYAVYECEHCGHVTGEKQGYDDANFHNNVIPAIKCPNCGKKAAADTRALAPKHPEDAVI